MEDLLRQILEGQNSIKEELSSVKSDINKINIKIENMEDKINLLVEGHKSILESNDRTKNEIIKEVNLRLEIVEKVTIKTSEDLNFTRKELEFVGEETALNSFEVKKLKKVR